MKKLFLLLATALMSVSAFAFEFDGINLNDDAVKITRAISAKNYVNDPGKDRLKGNCQGTDIFLSFNFTDVSKEGKVGQLIIDIPQKEANAFEQSAVIFNVIYHQTDKANGTYTYAVDKDGTTMLLEKTAEGIRLTYNTMFFKKKK